MKVDILAITSGAKDFSPLVDEYMKRLDDTVTITNIPPVKHGSKQQIIEQETNKLMKRLQTYEPHTTTICLLSKEGKPVTSEAFASLTNTRHCVFCIGGPYGLDENKLQKYLKYRLSLGRQTMAHGLVKVVLLEQLRRAHCIQTGKEYHY